MIAGSLALSACFGNVKKDDKYNMVDCGPGWEYKIEKAAVDSVRRALHLRGAYVMEEDMAQISTGTFSGAMDGTDQKKRRLERLVVVDSNRDKVITEKEANMYEESELKLFQDELVKQDKASSKAILQNFRGK